MKTFCLHIIIYCLLFIPTVQSRDNIVIGGLNGLDPEIEGQQYSVLLALSGGGARGLATIGILQAFEENGIHVVAIAGTSMGGIIGGLYASGYTPQQLKQIVRGLDFTQLFTNKPARRTMFQTKRRERGRELLSLRFNGLRPDIPQGFTSGQKLTEILTRLTTRATYRSSRDFTRLPIPFKTICTDMVTGKPVIFDNGSLADAMRATTAFPLAFTGVEQDGKLLMDGGMVIPVPVSIVSKMSDSVRFVVAVNTASPLSPKEKLTTPVDIANQATSIMTADKLAKELADADFVITPVSDEIQASDFKLRDSIIKLGYIEGQQAADSLRLLLQQQEDHILITIDTITFNTPLNNYSSTIFRNLLHRTFSHQELIRTLKKIVRQSGLFQLQAELIPLTGFSAEIRRYRLVLSGFPNPKTAETNITCIGNTVFSDSVINARIATALVDSYITPASLRAVTDSILKLYRTHHYDLAYIHDIQINPQKKQITLYIDEAIIKRIDVVGTRRTRDWFVRSLFPLHVGQPYSTRLASQGIANIFGTDLFDRVTVDLLSDNGKAIVRIRVEEKLYRQMRLGWHWDDEYDSEEFIELFDDNIAGAGLELLFHARYSPDRQNYYANFKADRIFSTYLTGNIRVYHTQLDRHLYDAADSLIDKREELKTGFDIRLGQQISRLGTVTAGIEFEDVRYEMEQTGDKETFGLRIFKLESLVENFDRIPFPNSGKQHYFELQLAGKLFGGDVEYTRFFTSVEAYFAFGTYFNYHPRFAVGISRSGLPASEKFYLGGMRSLSGLRTFQLSGDKMLLMSHELRIKLPLWLYFSIRYDLGNTFISTDDIKIKDLRHAVGAFLSLDSPLGPFEIGYGMAEDNYNRLYVRFGYEF